MFKITDSMTCGTATRTLSVETDCGPVACVDFYLDAIRAYDDYEDKSNALRIEKD